MVLAAAGLGLAACTSPAPPAAASSPQAVSASAEAPPTGGPDNPLGLDPVGLTRWFGAPSLIRRDYPAEVWQYRAKGCVLELYLYPVGDHMAVTHAEAREPGMAGDALKPCLSVLSGERRRATQS